MIKKWNTSRIRCARGQAIVEYALVFPIQLMLTLAIIQLAHIFVAKQILQYAAFCGARAVLVGLSNDDAKQAAVIPIARIAGPSGATSSNDIDIPGWGTDWGRSGAALDKTELEIIHETDNGTPVVQCTVRHDYELQVPIGNFVVNGIGEVFLGPDDLVNIGGAPHLRMKSDCSLAQPWEP